MANHNLEQVQLEWFKDHPHYLNIWDYGAHPRRVMVGCFYCGKFAFVNWKDTYARTLNRIVTALPAAFTLLSIVVVIVVTIIAILPYAHH